MPDKDELYDTKTAAAYINIDARTLEGWRYRGQVGPKFLRYSGRIVRYRRSDLDAFMERCAVMPMREID
jgi:hypothetical protein